MIFCPKCSATNLLFVGDDIQCQFCGHEFERERQGWDDEDDEE